MNLSTSQCELSASATPLRVADLLPVAGLADQHNKAIFALCDVDTANTATALPVCGIHAYCQQLRRALDADTVYVCTVQRDHNGALPVIASSSATDSANTDEDTADIHRLLTQVISDLETCRSPVRLPDLQVFDGTAKMSFMALPVGRDCQRITVIVDGDSSLDNITQYYADAVNALYQAYIQQDLPLTTRQAQIHVFDELNRHYWNPTEQISERRYALFQQDLRKVTVQFEKILEMKDGDSSGIWGWEVVANCNLTDQFPTDLFVAAEEWGEEFRSAIDMHVLHEATHRYKEVSEAANVAHFAEMKPLCLSVYPQTLRQTEYIELLRELTEKVVMHGSKLVFEISEKISLSGDSVVEQISELNEFAAQIDALREEFDIRIALDEFGAGNSSLSRFFCLEPEIIKMDRSILSGNDRRKAIEFLQHFSQLAYSRNKQQLEVIIEGDEGEGTDESESSPVPAPQIESSRATQRVKVHQCMHAVDSELANLT